MKPLPSLRSAWDAAKGWVLLVFFIWVLWCLRKVFLTAGDTLGGAADAATAGARDKLQNATDRARVQSVAPVTKKTQISDASLAKWRADAKTLAGYFGTDHFGSNTIVPDQLAAFHLLKTGYARLLLVNNKPCHKVAGHTVAQEKESADSIANPVNWKVLEPFYRDATGNDLLTDIRRHIKDVRVTKILSWVI